MGSGSPFSGSPLSGGVSGSAAATPRLACGRKISVAFATGSQVNSRVGSRDRSSGSNSSAWSDAPPKPDSLVVRSVSFHQTRLG